MRGKRFFYCFKTDDSTIRKGGRQMNYEQFLEQMKEDLTARFAKDLPPELADTRTAGVQP